MSMSKRQGAKSHRTSAVLIAVVAALLAALSLFQALSATFDYVAISAYSAREMPDRIPRDVRLASELTVRLFPWSAPYWLRRAWFLGEDACETASAACDLRIASLTTAAQLRPYWALPWALLMSAHAQQGAVSDDMAHALARAVHLGPHDEPVRRRVLEVGLRYWDQLPKAEQRWVQKMIAITAEYDSPLLAGAALQSDREDVVRAYLGDAEILQRFEQVLAKQRASEPQRK